MPDLAEICSVSVWSCRSRISVATLPSASALAALASSTRCRSYSVGLGTTTAVLLALENLGITFRHILRQRRLDDGCALEAQTLAIGHHAIHQRAVEQLSGAADLVPSQPVLPTTVVEIVEEALDVARILHENVVVNATTTGELRSGVRAKQGRARTAA